MKFMKRFLGFFLCLAMLLPMLPTGVFAADANVESMDDGYIKVDVSTKNGGFLIGTVEGNRLKKSDNNKNLLYHNGQYDTSFISFRVGEGAAARDYIFGGSYPGKSSTDVTVTTDGESIVATWGVEGITFTETFTLPNQNANEHGLVSISLSVSGTAEPVQARVLLDTSLGSQDYGYYQTSSGRLSNTLQTEQDLTDPEEISNFYAVDDVSDPAIQARVVSTPVRVSIGHWNNLAATLFDFVPNTTMNFTNSVNEYLTADSAVAMYYGISAANPVTIFYGVYSNWDVLDTERVAINLNAPSRLHLNEDKTAFIRQEGMPGIADFSVHVTAENYISETSQDYENVLLVVSSTSGLRSLGDSGEKLDGLDYESIDPLTVVISPFNQNTTEEKTLYFQARLRNDAAYERITVSVYNNTEGGDIVQQNLLGQRVIYILLPGSDGNVPQIHFTAMSPTTVYHEGMRHLYISVANPDLMENALESGKCELWVTTLDNSKHFVIPSSAVTFTDGVADVVLDEEVQLPVGACRVELHWTPAAISEGIISAQFAVQSAKILEFNVSDDPKYRNDSYGIIAAVKYGTFASTDDPVRYELRPFKSEEEFKLFSSKAKDSPYENETYKEILLVYRGAFVGDRRYSIKDTNGKIIGYSYYSAVSKETIKDGKSRVDNTITINNCLDFEAGTMAVYYEDYALGDVPAKQSAILCEFDGKLYTSVARTSVWEGKAALTKLEQGSDFSLITYNENGVRTNKNSNAAPITLIWPNIYGYGQKLAGMIFKLAYGQFGVMYKDGQELGRVVGFAASLNLSFMKSPQSDDDTAVPDTYFGKMKELWTDWRGASIYQYAYHGSRYEKLTDIGMNDSTEEHNKAQQGVAASVMVPDILFGCGEGFVGLHFSVELTIQNMIDSLPKITGKLEVNTIGNWSFSLEGSCKLEKFTMEAKLSFKSRDNIPIPDEIYFYMGGFDPGLNIDGCGTVWLKGLGGGISNIYDTIFMTSGLPPLKLTVKAAFSIIQILDGKAKLELSLSGIKLTATDLKIKDTIEVIQSIMLNLQWYPDLVLQASIYVKMFEGVIQGNGYIALVGKGYTDWDFEMFARIRLCIPESIPAVGGMTLLGIDVGIGTKKIWGAFQALGLSMGVTYYWGESGVHVGTGGDYAQPSYPSLLQMNGYDEDNPGFVVGYDEDTDRYLYALFGTNFEPPVGAQVVSEDQLRLLGLDDRGIWSNLTRTKHKINLGEYVNDPADYDYNASTLVQANYPAASLAEAQAIAETFWVNDREDGSGAALPLSFPQVVPDQNDGESDEDYEARIGSIVTDNMNANANVTWSENMVWDDAAGEYVSAGTGGIATFAFTLTDPSQFDKDWYLSTDSAAADVVFYNVLALPQITEITQCWYDDSDNSFNLDWYGIREDELDFITFYLTKGNTDPLEEGVGLGYYDGYQYDDRYFQVPADLPSGDYYVRAVYSKEGEINGVIWSDFTVNWVNPNMPAAMDVDGIVAAPCGDLQYAVSIPATDDANTTGYLVEILDANGEITELGEMFFDRALDASGNPTATTFEIGGSYSMDIPDEPGNPDSATHVETVGLTAGETYSIRITPYCAIEAETYDPNWGGTNGGVVYGDVFTSSAMVLPEAITPTVTVTCGGETLTSVRDNALQASPDADFANVSLSGSTITLNAAFSEAVTGVWILDDSDAWDVPETLVSGGFSGSTAVITLNDLTEGGHVLTIKGQSDARGDRFTAQYAFNVDTLAPRLMIQSPLNGSPFNADGTVTVSGITDPNVTIHVRIDGGAESTYMFKSPLDPSAGMKLTADGWFSVDVDIPDANSAPAHEVEIWAVDANGNTTYWAEDVDGNMIPYSVEVSQPGYGRLSEYALMVDGAVPEAGGISTLNGGVTNAQLTVVGVIVESDGSKTFFAIDNAYVHWRTYVAEGSASVSPDGVLNCDIFTKGFVEAQIEVTTGAFRTALLALAVDSMPGDLNGDNKVNTLDLVRLQKYLLDPDGTTLFASADLNADGSVNGKDLVHLKKYLLFENVELH